MREAKRRVAKTYKDDVRMRGCENTARVRKKAREVVTDRPIAIVDRQELIEAN